MLKKILFGIVMAALLTGAGNLLAKEKAKHKQQPRIQQKAAKQVGHSHIRPEQFRRRSEQPIGKRLNRCLNALTKAYREKDMKKIGQIVRKMNKARQSLRKQRADTDQHRRWSGRRFSQMRRSIDRPNRDFRAAKFDRWHRHMFRGGRSERGGRHRWFRPGRRLGW